MAGRTGVSLALLHGQRLQLVENPGGMVSGPTAMVFADQGVPLTATYSGPEVQLGQVLLAADLRMVYHALTRTGDMVAGAATVAVAEYEAGVVEMRLQWRWLTGEGGSGQSVWRSVSRD